MMQLPPEIMTLAQPFGWALVHSLWQGALIAGCLWLMMRLLANAAATLRYRMQLLALILQVGWFAATWWQHVPHKTGYVDAAAGAGTMLRISLGAGNGAFSWPAHLEGYLPWVVVLYGCGLMLMLVRFSLGLARLRRDRHTGLQDADETWQRRLTELSQRLALLQRVRLFYSTRITMPMMIGLIRPVILLPVGTVSQLPTDQIEAILLHELAHIRRHDYLVNLLQVLTETLLFFNPFTWWISAGIRHERELCCDDLVLAHTQRPLPYAHALAALEVFRNASQPLSLAAGGQKHHLFHRIKRITEMKKNPLSYGRLAAAILIAGAITGSVIWFSPAAAQHKKSRQETTHTQSVQRIIVIDNNGKRTEVNSVDDLPEAERQQVQQALRQIVPDGTTLHLNSKTSGLILSDTDLLDSTDDIAFVPALPRMPHMPHLPHLPQTGATNESARQALDEADKALAAIDWKSLDRATRQSLEDANRAIAKANDVIRDFDWSSVNAEVEEAMKAARSAKQGNALRQNTLIFRRELAEDDAYEGQRSTETHAKLKELKDVLVADGLVNEEDGYTIRKNSADLYINGKVQPDEVKIKYRRYFPPGKVEITVSGRKVHARSKTIELE